MKRGASAFVGRHDFTNYTTRDSLAKHKYNAMKDIQSARVIVPPTTAAATVQFEVTSSGFMYHQVRQMAGILLEVGIGKRPVSDIGESIKTIEEGRKGREFCPNLFAPAKGLCLMSVKHQS